MINALGAVVSGLMLVLASMFAGGIIYVVVKDAIKRNIDRQD
ncbi:MAG: hypothetical protein AABZ00_10755 [Chloroflexota bacterium]